MDDLWQILAELSLQLHPDRVEAIATKLESLGSAEQFAMVKRSFGPIVDTSTVDRLDLAWRSAKKIGPKELAAALRCSAASAATHDRLSSVELVWTGPTTGLVPIRHTEQVLCEVIESARKKLFLVSFVVYEVVQISRALQDAAGRHVRVQVLLEPSTQHGGKVTVDSVRNMKEAVPSADVYVWNADGGGKSVVGSVHAKCAVCDSELAFITSANLSMAAMERNMELGVLVRGGHLPDELHRHLAALVSTEIVRRI